MRRALILAAAAVVLAANAWTLIAARHNRREPSGGTLKLTERELHLVQVPWESTATLLEVNWDVRSDTARRRGAPTWLDAAKLAELGFDCMVPVDSPNAKEHYRALPPVQVFLVLEYAGEAWRAARRHRDPKTRLFVVDAGRDAERLRGQYADARKHAIVRGVVRLRYENRSFPEGTLLARPRLQGRIESILPSQIFVPLPFSRRLEGFRRDGPAESEPPEGEPRFAVTVSWGLNYEPWVRGVRPLVPESPEKETRQ